MNAGLPWRIAARAVQVLVELFARVYSLVVRCYWNFVAQNGFGTDLKFEWQVGSSQGCRRVYQS